jgi:hypothetical protein
MTVTAVMLTGKPERRPLATIAIECFMRQTHADAELLIVNHSGTPFEVSDERVREIVVDRPRSLGDLRNLGLEHARGEHLITWDDDDWHHPRRIELQLAACTEDYDAIVLRSYLVLDLTTGVTFGRSCGGFECGGCCGTILHRRASHRYPARNQGEDAEFVRAFRGRLRVLDNAPSLYVRTYSGHNVSSRAHVVERPSRSARIGLTSEDQAVADAAAKLYGVWVAPVATRDREQRGPPPRARAVAAQSASSRFREQRRRGRF